MPRGGSHNGCGPVGKELLLYRHRLEVFIFEISKISKFEITKNIEISVYEFYVEFV
jgi:hypothetical protein